MVGMLNWLYPAARAGLFMLSPEEAHGATLSAMEAGSTRAPAEPRFSNLAQTVFGLTFANPVGIAAGFDKDARVPDAVLGIGCGFAEIGTVTPLPQDGNPQPRVFRLVADRAVINRLGFNNGGHAAALARLEARTARGGIVGVNIGANKDAADRAADYVRGLKTFYDVASYFTVNISSPNTPGLRDLQAPAALDELLSRLMAARAELVAAGAPQAADRRQDRARHRRGRHRADRRAARRARGRRHRRLQHDAVARGSRRIQDAQRSRRPLRPPLFHRSTVMLARVHRATGGTIPLIGIGGIDSAQRRSPRSRPAPRCCSSTPA